MAEASLERLIQMSDEVENFKREIQIDADATFLDLRNAICDCTGYDKSQMSSFFLCDEGWERDKEITLEDMGSDSCQGITQRICPY